MSGRANGCRSAARRVLRPPSTNIWITDEVLDRAWSRFARQVVTPTRHASNVPGPLEARRRLERRRMGGVSVPRSEYNQSPSLFSGFGLVDRSSNDTSWSWKRPTVSKRRSQQRHQEVDTEVHNERSYRTLLQDCSDLASIEHLHASLAPQLPVVFSNAAFDRLTALSNGLSLFDEIFAFLQGGLNESGSHNTHKTLHWLDKNQAPWSHYHTLICILDQKLGLATISCEEVQQLLHGLVPSITRAAAQDASTVLSEIFQGLFPIVQRFMQSVEDHLSLARLRQALVFWVSRLDVNSQTLALSHMLSRILTDSEAELLCSGHGQHLAASLPASLSVVDMCHSLQAQLASALSVRSLRPWTSRVLASTTTALVGQAEAAPVISHWLSLIQRCAPGHPPDWNAIYAAVSTQYSAPALHTHFVDLSPSSAADRLLRHWLVPANATSKPAIISSFRKSVAQYSKECTPTIGPFVDALRALPSQGSAVNEVFALVLHYLPPNQVFRLFMQCARDKAIQVPTESAQAVAEKIIAAGHTGWALQIIEQSPHISLASNPDILIALAAQDQLPSKRMLSHLRRMKQDSTDPQQTAQTIQHLACTFAASSHLSSRAAYRRIYNLYRTLKPQNAQLATLLSRALVHAGMTRSLLDGRWISRERVAWVLEIVRDIEGDGVARQVDEMAYIWREQIRKRSESRSKVQEVAMVDDKFALEQLVKLDQSTAECFEMMMSTKLLGNGDEGFPRR